ncbi:MAG: nuclear transport factor 2 family protein [Deltaproteobacteria bacterium]
MRFPPFVVLAALSLAACARNIPNTEIRDTPDNRAIIGVIDSYRKAFDTRNTDAVMALVSPAYYDDAGTVDPSDDIDYKALPGVLRDTFTRISQVRIEFGITDIIVNGNKAQADLFYDAKYRVMTPRVEIPKRDTDIQRILFERDGQTWKIVSGL